MNVENFKRVLDHIKAHPETWKQNTWYSKTAYCFGGHAQVMSNQPHDNYKNMGYAETFLDISLAEANYLFGIYRTIADFDHILAHGFPSQVSGDT